MDFKWVKVDGMVINIPSKVNHYVLDVCRMTLKNIYDEAFLRK